ncbi:MULTISPECIES: 6-phosphogluconolactonase [unclassified Corynebacterium]|uniref:6-phosphogluconolactonase n=1 Tax=unclassified Corynebacterium TaxID=2624378 RepID=UPI001EF24CE8|nr:6-phosphogluconolactonase [Corynebacterium sp. ACRPH]MCG7455774.1 6-phosphogluconolactonase [Corynebacterium sp. ACRPH]
MKPTQNSRRTAVVSDKTGVELRPRDNKQDLATAAAREFINTVAELQRTGDTVTGDGMVRVVLTGGGAGIDTLAEIAALDHAAQQTAEDFPVTAIDWSQVYVFFGDERFLAAGDPERNDKQAFDALLRHVNIPSLNVFRVPALAAGEEADGPALDSAAEFYGKTVDQVAPEGFDIHLLGMGPEGHINSLFPHTDALLHAEGSVVAVRECPKPPAERISLTMQAVNRSRQVWLLVSGEEKKEAAGQVFNGGNGAEWPAALASGTEATLLWVDEAANPLL